MKKQIAYVLITTALVALVFTGYYALNLSFWLLPPEQKFREAVRTDIELLEKTKKLPEQWRSIRSIAIRTDNSPAQDWTPNNVFPIPTDPKGLYQLEIFITHWIDHNRYGVVVQYELFDVKTKNLQWHLGRTFHLGFVY